MTPAEHIDNALARRCVLITRPAKQTALLAAQVEQHQGTALQLPAMAIEAAEPIGPDERRQHAGPADVDVVIFVSQHAVQFGAHLVPPHSRVRVGAIGPSTANALHERGLDVHIEPPDGGFTTEALLQHPSLQRPRGLSVLIVRGKGGRELLGCKLLQRGAELSYAEVYHRVMPPSDAASVIAHWQHHGIDLITATSVQTLENLQVLLGDSAAAIFASARLVTASERVVQRARSMAVQQRPLMASGPDNRALLDAILGWAASAPRPRARG